ncbi:MAG: hypothetical protein [Caudoviricetes sp.]|nr:MAG: hypothetical protein [Caudoviricetes sp.]
MRKFIFDDTGTGKTKRSIEMMVADKCESIIVVCPANVVKTTWIPQVAQWCPGAKAIAINTKAMNKQKASIVAQFQHPDRPSFFVVSYNSIPLVEPLIYRVPQQLKWGAIFDESHYTKSIRSLRHKNSVVLSRKADSVLMLTATPTPRSLEDAYGQCTVLYPARQDRMDVYGDGFATLGAFRDTYGIMHTKWIDGFAKHDWEYRQDQVQTVADLLASTTVPIVHSDMRQPNPFKCIVSAPSAREVETFDRWVNDEQFIDSTGEINAKTASELANKKAQLDDGFIYDEDGNPHWFGDSKLGSVVRKALSLYDKSKKPVLVWTRFRASFNWIMDHAENAMDAKTFIESPDDTVKVIVGSQQSMGTGVDGLQHYASCQIWVDLPYTAAEFTQANARLIRKGQPDRNPAIFIADTEINHDVFEVIQGRAEMDRIIRRAQHK